MPAVGKFHRQRFPVRLAPGSTHYLVVFAEMLAALDLPHRLSQIRPPYPVLILHGAADGIIPVEQAREAAGALGDRARLEELPTLHHLDPLFDDPVIGRIIEYVEETVSRKQAPSTP